MNDLYIYFTRVKKMRRGDRVSQSFSGIGGTGGKSPDSPVPCFVDGRKSTKRSLGPKPGLPAEKFIALYFAELNGQIGKTM